MNDSRLAVVSLNVCVCVAMVRPARGHQPWNIECCRRHVMYTRVLRMAHNCCRTIWILRCCRVCRQRHESHRDATTSISGRNRDRLARSLSPVLMLNNRIRSAILIDRAPNWWRPKSVPMLRWLDHDPNRIHCICFAQFNSIGRCEIAAVDSERFATVGCMNRIAKNILFENEKNSRATDHADIIIHCYTHKKCTNTQRMGMICGNMNSQMKEVCWPVENFMAHWARNGSWIGSGTASHIYNSLIWFLFVRCVYHPLPFALDDKVVPYWLAHKNMQNAIEFTRVRCASCVWWFIVSPLRWQNTKTMIIFKFDAREEP